MDNKDFLCSNWMLIQLKENPIISSLFKRKETESIVRNLNLIFESGNRFRGPSPVTQHIIFSRQPIPPGGSRTSFVNLKNKLQCQLTIWTALVQDICFTTNKYFCTVQDFTNNFKNPSSNLGMWYLWWNIRGKKRWFFAGLGTPFFSVRYVTFFSVLKKEHSVLFHSFLKFLATNETQKNIPFFLKERNRTFHSF